MTNAPYQAPQRLLDIVATRPPWLRTRLSTILVWPTIQGAWTAILNYAHYSAVQPGETAPPGINVTYPHDTHHSVALDGADVVAAFRSQMQELERGGELGPLTVSRVAEPSGTPPGGPPTAAWTILTHSGSDAERRAWQRGIGQETL